MNGRKVVVTAGGSGIGRVIANAFAKSGASVATCDIDPACATAQDMSAAIRCWQADIGEPESAGRFMTEAISWLDGIDVLINNAGVSGPTKPVEEITDDEWRRTMEVNVNGQFYCVRAAVPVMKAQKAGVILNISSTAGRMGMPRRSVYSASKYAVRGFTDVLAVELGDHNIRVNAILPGVVNGTRVRRVLAEQAQVVGQTLEEYMPRILHNVSMHTAVEAEDVANMALFLASDGARFVSGQSIGVCGNFESYRGPLTIGQGK
ncbi:SDR family oxidoreductase [Taklimakanibacter deserti]|uniref:SDR family oxidoreductase n=1 Tax=Taklimakanibacter deserti TaxID=2267839 RepID=UPI0034D70EAC